MIHPPQSYVQAPPDSSGKKFGTIQLVISDPSDPSNTNTIQLQQFILSDKQGITLKDPYSVLEEIRDELVKLNEAIEMLNSHLE